MRKYLYFMQRSSDGLIKIGESDNPEVRRQEIQSKLGDSVVLLYYLPQPVPIESMVHDKYRGDRIEGEWFSPTEELLDYIKLGVDLHHSKFPEDPIDPEEDGGCLIFILALLFLLGFMSTPVFVSYLNHCVDANIAIKDCSFLLFAFGN